MSVPADLGSAKPQPRQPYSLVRGDTVGDAACVAADALLLGDADLTAQLVRDDACVYRRLAQQRGLKGRSRSSEHRSDKLLMLSLPSHWHTGVTARKIRQRLKRNKSRGGRKNSHL